MHFRARVWYTLGMERKAYPSDESDDEWVVAVPWLGHDTRARGRSAAGVCPAVDTPGQLPAVLVTPANEQDRAQVAMLAEQIQKVTGESAEVAFVDQGYTGELAAADAEKTT